MASPRLWEVATTFLKLGCTSFGGPVAHLGYLRTECVGKRGWLEDAHFADLVALCQFLPGPASSQLVFALGHHRAGLAGALVASVCFTLPSAVLMVAFALGMANWTSVTGAGWLHGLMLAAVAVVAQAVWRMGRTLCPDVVRRVVALLVTAGLWWFPGAGMQLLAMLLGALVGLAVVRVPTPSAPVATERAHPMAALALLLWAALLLVLPAIAQVWPNLWTTSLDLFYRAGSLVFGGGHVVLPLLEQELVPRGLLTREVFLAGYGAAQAVPGPLFTLAAYLGTAMTSGPLAWIHGVWCLLAIFVPAWLLVGGALPFWGWLRTRTWAANALAGANASVVGVLFAALLNPVLPAGVHNWGDAVAATAALLATELLRAPSWLVVGVLVVLGQWVL